MVSQEDLEDIVAEEIKICCSKSKDRAELHRVISPALEEVSSQGKRGFFLKEPFNKSYTSLKTKRRFFSEWEIKKLLEGDKKSLKVPPNSIISPLAQDWLGLKGIDIVIDP